MTTTVLSLAAGVFFLLSVLALAVGLHTVEAGTRVLVRRFGQVHRELSPGLHIRLPIADQWDVVRTGIRVHRFEGVAETADHLRVFFAGDVRYRVQSVQDFLGAQSIFGHAIETACQSALAEALSHADLDQMLGKQAQLPSELRFGLDDRLAFAGVAVDEVQIASLRPMGEAARLLAERALLVQRRDVVLAKQSLSNELRAAAGDVRRHELALLAEVSASVDERTLQLLRMEFERSLVELGSDDRL